MAITEPAAVVDARYSEPGATATAWSDALDVLTGAQIFWLSTVRPDGRPHVTPLLAVWLEEALHFTTGGEERKARNLAANPHVTLTTGTNALEHGLDIVLEGDARRVTDDAALTRIAEAYTEKYGSDWTFTARGGELHHAEGGAALAFRVAPRRVFGFRKGAYSQTCWRFPVD
ncbi:pyridoxamine 5'-phosphate oxidase family protein [Streptomyces litchfieldiae]|uniref:Pyridoxamine 5'-phosphate oxidase family protein n=1 Tax=Streptomyces litchfieldiae TaxID=3075543 RepID=A0ABU2N0F4_9ACTN|nr:pyridoxamine 5'-phosphate oxidase family protein [Streptomyces sp. DSM 44938]MDT0347008.1 pyridoxamine 5'-phosphate oxidase family protein [Streptomyces sp. DSM 44938]